MQECTEAILDAAIRRPTSLHTAVADVTARCPHASRCRGDVTTSPTEAAEDEKHKRHGPRVTPIAFSTNERLGREGRNALEALAAKARWNSDDPSTQRNQVARWRKTLEQDLLHAQADVLLLSLDAQGCAGWQRHAGTPFGRQRTAAKHTYKLTDEQVATIRANRVIAEARRQVLRAQNYHSEQNKAEETSESELEEQHEISDNDAWKELNRPMHDDDPEDLFDHMQLDMDTTPSPTKLHPKSEPEPAHAAQQHCAAAQTASWVSWHAPRRALRVTFFLVVSSFHLVHCR